MEKKQLAVSRIRCIMYSVFISFSGLDFVVFGNIIRENAEEKNDQINIGLVRFCKKKKLFDDELPYIGN